MSSSNAKSLFGWWTITQHQKIEKNITVSNPLAGTNYIISSSSYFQFFFVLVVVWLNKVYQIDINTLTRLIRNVVVTCEISTHTHI
jgi:hypothetical protein